MSPAAKPVARLSHTSPQTRSVGSVRLPGLRTHDKSRLGPARCPQRWRAWRERLRTRSRSWQVAPNPVLEQPLQRLACHSLGARKPRARPSIFLANCMRCGCHAATREAGSEPSSEFGFRARGGRGRLTRVRQAEPTAARVSAGLATRTPHRAAPALRGRAALHVPVLAASQDRQCPQPTVSLVESALARARLVPSAWAAVAAKARRPARGHASSLVRAARRLEPPGPCRSNSTRTPRGHKRGPAATSFLHHRAHHNRVACLWAPPWLPGAGVGVRWVAPRARSGVRRRGDEGAYSARWRRGAIAAQRARAMGGLGKGATARRLLLNAYGKCFE